MTDPDGGDFSDSSSLLGTERKLPESECLDTGSGYQCKEAGYGMVPRWWIHNGSSIEGVAYDGKNLSEYGDVVVVTVNHRLNVLGYLDVSEYGEDYQYSGNCGTADMIASLQWVKENIANFGGRS